jgi:hypothetical protein
MNFQSRQDDLLFFKADINALTDAQQRNMGGEIQGLDPDRLLNTPVDDLVAYFAQKYRIEVPTLHRDRALLDEPRETYQEVNDYGRQIRIPSTLIKLTVPFDGEKDMFYVRPSTFDTAPPRAAVTSDGVVLELVIRSSEQDQVKNTLNRALDDIERYLGWQRPTIEAFNANLAGQARQAIEARRARLLQDRNLVSGLGFAVKPRAGAPQTYAAPQARRKIEPKLPPASSTPFKPEPVLQEQHYQHILNVIDNMTVVMERSPTAFAEMGEEDIRQHYLVQLNGHFEGAATGRNVQSPGQDRHPDPCRRQEHLHRGMQVLARRETVHRDRRPNTLVLELARHQGGHHPVQPEQGFLAGPRQDQGSHGGASASQARAQSGIRDPVPVRVR